MGVVFSLHFIIGKDLESDQSTTARKSCCDMVLLLKIDHTQSASLCCATADIPFRLPWICSKDGFTHAKLNQEI